MDLQFDFVAKTSSIHEGMPLLCGLIDCRGAIANFPTARGTVMSNKILLASVSACFMLSIGCMKNAKYVEKHPDWGIVAVKSQKDEKEAHELIRKHIGEKYVIVDNYAAPSKTPGGFDPKAGVQQASAKSTEGMGWYIKYAKSSLPNSQMQNNMAQTGKPVGTPAGLPAPNMNDIQQTGFATPTPQIAPIVNMENTAPLTAPSTNYNPYGGTQR